jgi:competence protein ComEA
MKRLCATLLVAALLWPLAATAAKKPPAKPVNLNTATVEELAQLPGVGEVIAARIVRHRQVSGKFRSVDELLIVRGISRKKLDALRPYVRVTD